MISMPVTTKRNTQQRKSIEEVFQETKRPLSPEEVLEKGRLLAPTLNQATVYRNLKSLVEEDWLAKINLPEAGTLYERSNKGHHHHFHCRACKKSFDIHDCALNHSKNLAPKGFVVEDHEIIFYGTCSTCVIG
jgi:Fur family ferric uptake transcriptional regulator